MPTFHFNFTYSAGSLKLDNIISQHSIETALMKVQHDISDQLDKGRGVALGLPDLSAAFDTINPDGVINTLEQHIGVKGVALSWFNNYLNK